MLSHPPRSNILLAALGCAMLVVGCESLLGEGEDAGGGIGSAPIDLRVPKEVELVAQGRGELSYKARLDGQIYLHDVTAEKTLFVTPVERGQRFTIAPGEDRASLDGKDVFEGDMQTRNEHKVYFLPKR